MFKELETNLLLKLNDLKKRNRILLLSTVVEIEMGEPSLTFFGPSRNFVQLTDKMTRKIFKK